MYTKKILNFVSIYLAIMTDQSSCDEFADYLFAGSDKVTILNDYPTTVSHEPNQMETQKAGLLTKIKDVINKWISPTKPDEAVAPDIKFNQGTYSCAGNSCVREPDDKSINYELIKEDSARTTEPGENDLTRERRGEVHFIDPPEILRNIDPREMINALEKGYQEKERKKRQ